MTDQLEWEEFVRNDPTGEFYSLLKSCAKAIHRNISIWKEALANEGIVLESYLSMDWENTEYEYDFESAIEELANIIYTFLGNELVKRPHFAACYNEGNISLLMASIIKRFKMLLLDQQRARNTYQAYYRRCREALSDSEMVQCQNVYKKNNRGLPEGMRYAPVSEKKLPAPDRILLSPEEYREIPAPHYLEQRYIRRSSYIVSAALYFWKEVALRKGKNFVLIKEFVEYMRLYYNIFCGSGPLSPDQIMQWPLHDDRGGSSLEETVDDDKSELQNLEKEFNEYLGKTLASKDIEVFNALRNGRKKKDIISTITRTEHYYRKSMDNIKAALFEYDTIYYEAFIKVLNSKNKNALQRPTP